MNPPSQLPPPRPDPPDEQVPRCETRNGPIQ
jgi:hypothetical protein